MESIKNKIVSSDKEDLEKNDYGAQIEYISPYLEKIEQHLREIKAFTNLCQVIIILGIIASFVLIIASCTGYVRFF